MSRVDLSKRLFALAAVAILAGCATPASREGMTVTVSGLATVPSTVGVTARGGSETSALGASSASDADLKAAIEASITRSNLFKGVVEGAGGDYELTVFVTQVNKPSFGASMTVSMEAGWTLVRVADKSVVMRKSIKSTYTAAWNASFAGVERLRLALEGAVRENIKQGLEAIAEAKR